MRFFVLLLLLLASTPAFAQEAEAETAESLYQSAVKLFGEGRYREALKEFDRAIAVSPESIFFCNRAVVLIELSEPQAALESFTECQSRYKGDDAEELAQIDAQRAGVESVVRVVQSNSQNVANAIVADQNRIVQPPAQGWSLSSWGFLTLGIGGALLASAVTLDFLSEDLVMEFARESEGRTGTNETRFLELKEQIETRQLVFYALTGAGGVLAATGLTMIVIDLGSEDDPEIAISPLVSGDYAGGQLRLTW